MSRHTGVRIFVLFLASLLSTGVLADTVERRVLNNGELVLEDVPEIPAELRRELYRWQEVRSAAMRATWRCRC